MISPSLFDYIWNGTIQEDESHLEEVRKLFLNKLVEEDGNVELEQSTSGTDLERIKTLKKSFQWISAKQYYQRFQKSSQLSIQLREKANEYYKKGELENAMRGYNLAIVFGCVGETELGLAYGNRAAVLLSLKEPNLAVRDIILALENKYPVELQEKLIQRRRKCEEMKSNKTFTVSGPNCGSGKGDDGLVSFQKHIFSLKSASPVLTHAENFVHVEYDEKSGRKLVVTKPVPAGTVLLVEYPYVVALNEELTRDVNHCHHCFIRILGGIPCSSCSFATYCTLECQTKAKTSHHTFEHNLLPYLHNHKMRGRECFALRIITTVGPHELYKLFKSKALEENQVLSSLRGVEGNAVYGSSYAEVYSLIAHPESLDLLEKVSNAFKALIITNLLNESSEFFKGKPEYQEPAFQDFVASTYLHHLENIPYNSFSLSEFQKDVSKLDKLPNATAYATGLLPTVSLVNHSCTPNAIHVKKPKYCKAAFVTVKKLEPGEEVTISYGPHFLLHTRLERRAKMDEKYKFICQCQACVENWPIGTTNLDDLMLKTLKCPTKICTPDSKSLCRYCLENLRNLNERFEQFENQLHQAHELVMAGNGKSDFVKAFEILTHCLDNFVEFPPHFNLWQVAQDLLKRTLLGCAQADVLDE